jgi:hypothetical protein
MTISAYLGVAGLADVGYRFYTTAEVAVAARVTAGITDAGDGWYSASVTLSATSASVRWDSTGTATAKAREYWSDPWGHPVPDGYPSGTAGYVLGTNLDATVSSRATPAQVQTELGTYGALKPTTAGRTLDVTATGEAGIDWANVGSQGTTVGLTATTIANATNVTNPVALTSAYDAAKTAATQTSVDTVDGRLDTEIPAILAAVDTEVAAIKAKTDNLPVDPADQSDLLAQFATVNASLATISGYIDTEVAAIKAKTDQMTFTSGKIDANATLALVAADLLAIADAVLKRDFTAITGEAAYSLLNAARMLRNVWNTTGGTLSVKKEDGTTNAWQRPLSVDPLAQPIVGAS